MNRENNQRYNEEFATYVNEEFERRVTERRPFELQWRLNIQFIKGNQYMDICPVTHALTDTPRLYWYQEREVFNQLATIHETRVAKLSRQKPVAKVRPASNDYDDLASSKISSALLQSHSHDEKMDRKWDMAVSWLETCGTVFFKPIWNTNKGRVIHEDFVPKSADELKEMEDKALSRDDIQKDVDDVFMSSYHRNVLKEGDIETAVVSPFELYPDSCHTPLENMKSIIHARAYPVHDIEDIYGVDLQGEDVDVMTLQKSSSGMGGMGYSIGSYSAATTSLKNHIIVKEYYEKPTRKYPLGRFIVVAGDVCLYAGVLPYKIGDDGEPDLPFVAVKSIELPNHFFGDTITARCIPVQRRYNALRNRKQEYLNLVTIGQWMAPNGVLDEDSELTNEPGRITYYNDLGNGAKPEPIEFPNLPASFENDIQTLLNEFTAISGVSELSRFSEAPAGVKSGTALAITNEQDDTRIAMVASNIANASILLGKYWLRLYRQFVEEKRILRTVGTNNQVEVREWASSDLMSDDIIIENSSALAETPSQRRQMVFDLMGSGVFNREETNPFGSNAGRILELLQFGNWETSENIDKLMQESKAKRENTLMKEGFFAPTNDYDDDVLHMQEHNRVRMSPEYEKALYTEEGQRYEQMLVQHLAMHKQRMEQQMYEQQIQQQMGGQVPQQ